MIEPNRFPPQELNRNAILKNRRIWSNRVLPCVDIFPQRNVAFVANILNHPNQIHPPGPQAGQVRVCQGAEGGLGADKRVSFFIMIVIHCLLKPDRRVSFSNIIVIFKT